jgi:CO/xanthine dehydrogenase Mo-binding subunit
MPNASVHTRLVYTNNIVAGAMRAWGTVGVEFAMESQMNKLAHKLGIHPLKLRYANALRDGDVTISGAKVPPGNHFQESLRHAAAKEGLDLEGDRI